MSTETAIMPTPDPAVIERHADRLRRRGDFRLYPSTRVVHTWQDEDLRQYQEFGPCWAIVWWPEGQGPGRSEGMGNPFAQRSFIGDSIEEVLRIAFEETTPPWHSIDDLAWRRERDRQRAAERQAADHGSVKGRENGHAETPESSDQSGSKGAGR